MDINVYKFVFWRLEILCKIYIKIYVNNIIDIYSVYVCLYWRLFFFLWNLCDINIYKIYNLMLDFKSKLFKCNNYILIKLFVNKCLLN